MAGAALQEIREELQHDFDRWKEQCAVEYEQRGEQRGERKKSREMLLRSINNRFGTINRDTLERIKAIQSIEILDGLFDMSLRASSFDEFKEQVHRATDN